MAEFADANRQQFCDFLRTERGVAVKPTKLNIFSEIARVLREEAYGDADDLEKVIQTLALEPDPLVAVKREGEKDLGVGKGGISVQNPQTIGDNTVSSTPAPQGAE